MDDDEKYMGINRWARIPVKIGLASDSRLSRPFGTLQMIDSFKNLIKKYNVKSLLSIMNQKK